MLIIHPHIVCMHELMRAHFVCMHDFMAAKRLLLRCHDYAVGQHSHYILTHVRAEQLYQRAKHVRADKIQHLPER